MSAQVNRRRGVGADSWWVARDLVALLPWAAGVVAAGVAGGILLAYLVLP